MTGLEIFFLTKAILSISSLTMLATYTAYVWADDHKFPGRKMRYIALIWFTLVATQASARQLTSGEDQIYLEQWLSMVGVSLVFVTMIVSLYEIRRTKKV